MQALVLSAGLGTRLLPITNHFPKPLLPITYNTPLLKFIIENLKNNGVKTIHINCFHKKEQFLEFKETFYQADTSVKLIAEDELLNTSGSLINAKEFLTDEDFWVCNGDIFIKPPFYKMKRYHFQKKGFSTLMLGKLGKKPFTPIFLNKEGLVLQIGNQIRKGYKSQKGTAGAYFFTGLQYLNKRAFEYIPDGDRSSLTETLFYKWLEEDEPFYGYRYEGPFSDIGSPESYLKLNFRLNPRESFLDYSMASKINKGVKVRKTIALRKTSIQNNVKGKIILSPEVKAPFLDQIII